MTRARSLDRGTLLSPPKKGTDDTPNKSVYIITTFQPNFCGIKGTIKKNWEYLNRSNDTKSLAHTPLIFGYRRSKNLRDMLVRARIQYPPQTKPNLQNKTVAHIAPCRTAKCRYCPLLNKSGTIISTFTKRSFSTKIRVNCKSSNLIYCITCKICQTQYVGQTK